MIRRRLITKIQQIVLDLNDDFPLIGIFLVIGWTIIHRLFFILGKKIQELKGNLKSKVEKKDLEEIYWVNSKKIQYYLIKKSKKLESSPIILGGNWDKSKKLFKKIDLYHSFRLRFKEGRNWDETSYYNRVLNEIYTSKNVYGCSNKQEWDQYLKKLDSIYNHIKEQSKIVKDDYINFDKWCIEIGAPPFFNEITVHVDREGQLLLGEGEHFLSLVKLLKVPMIPIKIKTRHKKWIDFKKELRYFSRRGSLYQQVTHPDLQDFSVKHRDKRFEMIKEKLSISHGKLLDIGANLGYFCHKFEEEGFNCYAVEINPIYSYFLKKLRRVEARKFTVISNSIFSYNKNKELVFDVVLALNIFHNLTTRKKTYLKLIELLKRLKVNELYFGAHKPSEYLNARVYRNFTPTQFTNFIIKYSQLSEAEFIGNTPDGRFLFKLT